MPYYTYICEKCSRKHDLICSSSEKEEISSKMVCICGGKEFTQEFKLNLQGGGSPDRPEKGSCSGDSCSCCKGCS